MQSLYRGTPPRPVVVTSVESLEPRREAERQRERERERERESNPEEKSAADTDVYVDVEKHIQEGVRLQEAASTDDDTSRHTKE